MVTKEHAEHLKALHRRVYNDWGLYSFVQMLTYKCLLAGKALEILDERYTSRQCEPLFLILSLGSIIAPDILWYHHYVFLLLPSSTSSNVFSCGEHTRTPHGITRVWPSAGQGTARGG